ncbi:metal-dependent hydrolase [Parafilimonas terrae]|uniref:Inner membrane protein n=1 Tax=Parafilimonas terrae TaxID=1465490 RepID=A0A1I5TCG8_9BACT|nr:metal-dependent hydrolase [Parafilimonas terrae]SFP80735.1 inner membrane protein [Parafilimonas terrae]
MDSLTHIVIGACIGEAFAGKKLGKKAMLWGALVQSFPDIDFIAGAWLNPAENLLAHRGFTHSLLFAGIAVTLLALLAERLHRPHNISLKTWILFFIVEMLVHIFIDGFNAYGIGWLEPFSHHRFSFNAIFVIDPFFSIWAGIAFLLLLIIKVHRRKRKFWWKFGVMLPALYLCYCCINKIKIDSAIKKTFSAEHISYTNYFSTTTPFNNLLWYTVAETDSGFYVGYRSLFDEQLRMQLHFFPRNEYLLKNVSDQAALQNLKRFSKGFYTASLQNDTLVFNDLRFGQIAGWQNADAPFAFHYFLQYSDNALVVQRGRFAGWSKGSIAALLERISGDQPWRLLK